MDRDGIQSIYRDYVDCHGPVIYMLTWLIGLVVGFSEVWLFRLVSTFCALAAALSIFFSPLFSHLWQRNLATALWFGILSSIWLIQGLYLDSYWTIGGCFVTIGMATLIIPLLYNIQISKFQAFIGSFFTALLPFVAYPFALFLLALLLIVVGRACMEFSKYKSTLIIIVLGCCISTGLMVLWLWVYGDIGGMIAFHFIGNQVNYAHYLPFNFMNFLCSLAPSFASDRIVETFAVCAFFIGSIILLIKGKYKISVGLLLIAILSFQARGSVLFQNGTFLLASIAIMIISFIKLMEYKPKIAIILSCLSMVVIFTIIDFYALTSPGVFNREQRHMYQWRAFREDNSEEARIIRFYVRQDERMLSIPYNPDIYILAHRLPIKKYHAYLPWEADYALHPWQHYDRDICVDLPKNKPPVIYYDPAKIWNMYSPEQFLGCVITILKNEYTQIAPNSFIFIRNDRFKDKGQAK